VTPRRACGALFLLKRSLKEKKEKEDEASARAGLV